MTINRFRLVGLSVLCFLVCLWLDAFCESRNCSSGGGSLFFGWLSIPLSAGLHANITWLANPALFIAWGAALARRKLLAMMASVLALALAASFMLAREVVTNSGGFRFPITDYRSGYWLWLASIGIAVVAASITVDRSRPSDSASQEA